MKEYTDDSLMPWGRHRDKKLKDVPISYLKFIHDKFKWGIVKPMGEEGEAIRDYIYKNKLYEKW